MTSSLRPAVITFTWSAAFPEKLRRYAAETGQDFGYEGLSRRLHARTALGGVPAIIEPARNGNGLSMLMFLDHTCVTVLSSPHGDCGVIAAVEPMTLRHHGMLARRSLRLAPGRWGFVRSLRDLPQGSPQWWQIIAQAWGATAEATRTRVTGGDRGDAFCDLLQNVINADRFISEQRQADAEPLFYYAVESVAGVRHTNDSKYVFRLAEPAALSNGDSVEVRNMPAALGNVSDIDGNAITVSFRAVLDRSAIPEQGDLVIASSKAIVRAQTQAVATLRSGRSRQPRLLSMLTDRVLADWRPDSTPSSPPREALDPAQLEAFNRALSTPDLFLVQGPPGTGKTRTIAQIAHAAAVRGDRVLICAQNNKAVDNAVAKLPKDLLVVRVGNPDRIDPEVHHLGLSAMAQSIKESVRSSTDAREELIRPLLSKNGVVTDFERLLAAIDWELPGLADLRTANQQAITTSEAARRQIEAPWQAKLSAAGEERKSLQSRAAKLAEAQTAAEGRRRRMVSRLDGFLGFLFRQSAAKAIQRADDLRESLNSIQIQITAAEQAIREASDELRQAPDRDPTLRQLRKQVVLSRAQWMRAAEPALRSAGAVHRTMLAVGISAASPTVDNLESLYGQAKAKLPRALAAARLLTDWRETLAARETNLYPELLQFAQVIGGTCIGVAMKSSRVENLDYDLMILDEAGQVAMPSALVPMVRAKRIVLVGDHQQLPPFVDDDIRAYLDRPGVEVGPGLVQLLETSAFEHVHRTVPDNRKIMLTIQRRMPEVIADFASRSFYASKLDSCFEGSPLPGMFTGPLVAIDTSDQPVQVRREQSRQRSENWQVTGVENRYEAFTIREIVNWYHRQGLEWGVIVPYRAQVLFVRNLLRELHIPMEEIDKNLGTVDRFQGSERDVIIYGFTRSNDGGNVGFLSELRRLNVALTRAKRQLVVIGDFSTLTRARHSAFQQLARDLLAHIGKNGEVVNANDFTEIRRKAWDGV